MPAPAAHFLTDILSDAQGQSFHRFQMVIWTVVLTALFMVLVWQRISTPTFSGTLLALMGISAGTYLGFTFAEQQN